MGYVMEVFMMFWAMMAGLVLLVAGVYAIKGDLPMAKLTLGIAIMGPIGLVMIILGLLEDHFENR
jgi:hypothetical protein